MLHRQNTASQDPVVDATQPENSDDFGVPGVDASLLNTLTAQTPWWVVSVIFHGLMILLVGLLSLTVNIGGDDGETVFVTTPIVRPTRDEKRETPKQPTGDALVPARFDPSKAVSNIYVDEEFKAMAVEGPDFMTFDPGVVAKFEGAHGNPDALIMWKSPKPTDAAGGSGGGGTAFLEGMIGAGAANAGSGGGRYFGHGTGEGIQNGAGKGRFGRPDHAGKMNMFRRYNPPSVGVRADEWDKSIRDALQWLAYHQEADGHWDTKKFGSSNKNDVAITGLAMLAFLGYGNSEKIGDHKDNLKRAVAWMIKNQRADGSIVDDTDDPSSHRKGGYPVAIATLAICEAAGMANIDTTRAAAQKAVDYCVNLHQAGEGYDKLGWRYAPKMEGDLSVTGWFIMALKSAKIAGLKVEPAAFDGAIKFLDSVEHKATGGDPGYAPPSVYWYMTNNEHAGTAHRLTAIGTLARQFLGWKKEDLQASVDWFLNKGGNPAWGGNGEKVDLYYWYYGSMAVFQQGEPQFSKWSVGMLDALLPNQRKGGDENGSWDPVGDYSAEWGRVGQTALGALCLEVYYRYPKLNK